MNVLKVLVNAMSNLIGQSLGRYHILEQLGEGGMATVYKAYDTRLEHDVAIKIIRRGAFPPDQLHRILKRFEREAKSLAKLSHPNIIGVIEYGEHLGTPYLVMEFLPAGTLKQQLGKSMPWQKAVRLIVPVAHALGYAHNQKIVHRDVKPSNILITASGEPMLTDFGIAKLLETEDGQTLSTTTGVGVGTPEYMAPEQGLGNEVDARADIYSLGIVLYELITGRKPFRADTPMAVIVKHINEPLPRPKQFIPSLPDAVEKVLLKALAKKPQDRYQSMGAFAKALEELILEEKSRSSKKAQHAIKTKPNSEIPHIAAVEQHMHLWMWAILGITAIVIVGLFLLISSKAKPTTAIAAIVSSSATPAGNPSAITTPTITTVFTPTLTLSAGSTIVSPKDGMTMIFVPSGSFPAGGDCYGLRCNMQPTEVKSTGAFWIDKTDITNDMYAKCVNREGMPASLSFKFCIFVFS